MTSGLNSLAKIYRIYARNGGGTSAFLDDLFKHFLSTTLLSKDDERNTDSLYRNVFKEDSGCSFLLVFRRVVKALAESPRDSAEDLLVAMIFFQYVIATGLWRHRLTIQVQLSEFAREFDRLDVATERDRLFSQAGELLARLPPDKAAPIN